MLPSVRGLLNMAKLFPFFGPKYGLKPMQKISRGASQNTAGRTQNVAGCEADAGSMRRLAST